MDEGDRRDEGMKRARDGMDNQYELICDTVEYWLRKNVRSGEQFFSGRAFKAARILNSEISPAEKRVMGPVMKRMEKLRLIRIIDMSRTKTRSHVGLANKWIRI